MKRFLILIAAALLLASCGSSRHTCDAYSEVEQSDDVETQS